MNAFEIYTATPVGRAVEPIKTEAIERARKEAAARVERVIADIAANGWDLQIVAPYPNSWNLSRNAYLEGKRKYDLYRAFVRHVAGVRGMKDPEIVVRADDKIAKFIEDCAEAAAVQYDMFAAKLVNKIGEHSDATITGSHVWGYSILTVTTPSGVQRWKTQQIINVSKLGLLFNQWPSRKIK